MKFNKIALSLVLAAPAAACNFIVYCEDGMAYSKNDFTDAMLDTSGVHKNCRQACNGNCCKNQAGHQPTWAGACDSGRFAVCGDPNDGSCHGSAACGGVGSNGGSVGLISGGSCVGNGACSEVGYGGSVGLVSGGSCVEKFSCQEVGKNGGKVGDIIGGSCRGQYACFRAGTDGGTVGNIASGSCSDGWSCQMIGKLGVVGDLNNSCRGQAACSSLGKKNMQFLTSLESCCNGHDVCNCVESHATEVWDCPQWTPLPASCPTPSPTPSPTVPGPWTVDYVGAETDFTSGAPNELKVGFFVGVGREVDVKALKTCDAEAEVPSGMYTKTVSHMPNAPNESNLTHSKIIVGYTFNKAEMVGSSLWNNDTTQFNFCQLTRLTNPPPEGIGDAWVITEDRRQIGIKFDLEANFVVDVNLTAGIIGNATKTIDFDEEVNAYKCSGGSTDPFGPDDSVLPPNTKLAVCVTIENDAVNIADVTNMDINQEDINQDIVTTAVIDNGNAIVPAITDKRNIPREGTVVETRVPLNKFTFENGKNITVSGTVKLVLSGTAETRKLRALVDEDDLAVVDTKEAGFALSVNLQSEAEGFAPIGSSGGYAIVGKSLVAFGLAIVAAINLVM